MHETAWWGWEDSNFQPNDYQSLALSSRHRWPAPAWHGRRSRHRLAGGMVPTAPDDRPSCAVIARLLEQSKRNFCGRDEGAEIVSLKFNWPFAEKRAHTRQPRYFGHFASHEIPTSGAVGQCSELAADNRLVASSSPPSPRWQLITAWLEVRVLLGPPHRPVQTEISRCRAGRYAARDRNETQWRAASDHRQSGCPGQLVVSPNALGVAGHHVEVLAVDVTAVDFTPVRTVSTANSERTDA